VELRAFGIAGAYGGLKNLRSEFDSLRAHHKIVLDFVLKAWHNGSLK
jgi:hypothetical protein